jgi:hypothetical protein
VALAATFAPAIVVSCWWCETRGLSLERAALEDEPAPVSILSGVLSV